jgi:Methyltransferase FkbM domain
LLSDGTTGARFGDGFGTNVRVDTLNAYPPADLIKIDVAGAEAKVVVGRAKSLSQRPTILLEVNHWLKAPERGAMWATLAALGYTWKHIEGDEEGASHFLVT